MLKTSSCGTCNLKLPDVLVTWFCKKPAILVEKSTGRPVPFFIFIKWRGMILWSNSPTFRMTPGESSLLIVPFLMSQTAVEVTNGRACISSTGLSTAASLRSIFAQWIM